MDRASAQIPCDKAFRFANVDDATDCFAGTTAGKGSVSVNVLEFQNVAQDGLRTVGIIEQQSDPVKAPNRVFSRDVTAVPPLLAFAPAVTTSARLMSSGSLKDKTGSPKHFCNA